MLKPPTKALNRSPQGVVKSGITCALGARDRGFESLFPDSRTAVRFVRTSWVR